MIRLTRVLRCSVVHGRSPNFSTEVSLSENDNIKLTVFNRNPRNLERLRIARKPSGFHLEVPGREYWHKLELVQSNRYVSASLLHFSGKRVIEASTKEWAIKKYLYRYTDTAAYMNLGRIFAVRCLESGICEMLGNLDVSHTKISAFTTELEKAGISLSEPSRYLPWRPWLKKPLEKPWEVIE